MTNEEFTGQIQRAIGGICREQFREAVNGLIMPIYNKPRYKFKKYMNFIHRFIAKHRSETNG